MLVSNLLHMPWKPGESGNRRGRPPSGHAVTDAIRRSVSVDDLVANLKRISDGRPIYRWEDEHGIAQCGPSVPEGARAVTPSYPSGAESLRATEHLLERLEPMQKQVKLDVTQRQERPASRLLAEMNYSDLERLAGLQREQVKEPDAVDAELVEPEKKLE